MRKQKKVTSTRVIAFIVKSQANQHTTGGTKEKKDTRKKKKTNSEKKKKSTRLHMQTGLSQNDSK